MSPQSEAPRPRCTRTLPIPLCPRAFALALPCLERPCRPPPLLTLLRGACPYTRCSPCTPRSTFQPSDDLTVLGGGPWPGLWGAALWPWPGTGRASGAGEGPPPARPPVLAMGCGWNMSPKLVCRELGPQDGMLMACKCNLRECSDRMMSQGGPCGGGPWLPKTREGRSWQLCLWGLLCHGQDATPPPGSEPGAARDCWSAWPTVPCPRVPRGVTEVC